MNKEICKHGYYRCACSGTFNRTLHHNADWNPPIGRHEPCEPLVKGKRKPIPPHKKTLSAESAESLGVNNVDASYFNGFFDDDGFKQSDTPRVPLVSRAPLSRAAHRVGRAVPMAYLVVMAGTAWMLYRVSVRQEMILFLLNGGCLQ